MESLIHPIFRNGTDKLKKETNMKIPKGDGAFDKAWKTNCKCCGTERVLWFKIVCNACYQRAMSVLTIKLKNNNNLK